MAADAARATGAGRGGTTLASGGIALLLSGNPIHAMLFDVFGFALSAAGLNQRFRGKEQRLIEG